MLTASSRLSGINNLAHLWYVYSVYRHLEGWVGISAYAPAQVGQPAANKTNYVSWCKICTGPHTALQNAEFPANVNGLDITSSTSHSDEV
jgi:hypothetical protein